MPLKVDVKNMHYIFFNNWR